MAPFSRPDLAGRTPTAPPGPQTTEVRPSMRYRESGSLDPSGGRVACDTSSTDDLG